MSPSELFLAGIFVGLLLALLASGLLSHRRRPRVSKRATQVSPDRIVVDVAVDTSNLTEALDILEEAVADLKRLGRSAP